MATSTNVTVRFSGNASDLLSMFSSTADSADDTATKIGATFSDAATKMQASMADASAKIRAALDEAATGDTSVDELKEKFAGLATEIDTSMSDAMAKFTSDVEAGTVKASASVDAFRDKYASAMLQLDAANKTTGASVEEDVSKKFDSGTTSAGNLFTKLGNLTSSIPLVGESFTKMGENLAEAESSGQKMSSVMSDIGKISVVSGAAVAVGLGAETIHLASEQQSAATSLAASAQISVKAATDIGNAFQDTGFKSVYTGTQMTTAYTAVAAQLATVQGKALSTAQAQQVMAAASDLAEGSGESLESTTSALAATMQAFGLNAAQAASTSDILFTASEATGQSVEGLGGALDKVKSKLGGMSPPVGQLAGLLVDMTDHGETGRAAMSSLSTTFTDFLKPAADVATATNNLKVATDALPASLQGLAQQYASGAMTSTQLTAAEDAMSSQQDVLFGKFTAASNAMETANDAQAKMGISATTSTGQLKPLGDIIGQLQTQIKGMSTGQAIAQLTADGFSSASAKLVKTIHGGRVAYDAATAAVQRTNAAHEAAEKQAKTLDHQLEALKAGLEDEGVKIGSVLIPKLEELGKDVMDVVGFFEQHKTIAEALAVVIAGVLTTAVATWTVGLVASGVAALAAIAPTTAFGAAAAAAAIAIDGAMLPIAAIIVGLAVLGVAIYELVEHWSSVWGAIKEGAEDAWHFLDGIWQGIEGDMSSAWASIKDFLSTAWHAIVTVFEDTDPALYIATHWHQVLADAQSIWAAITGFFSSAWSAITAIFTTAVTTVENFLRTAWSAITADVTNFVNTVETFFRNMWSTVTNTVTSGIDSVVGFFEQLPSRVVTGVGNIAGDVAGIGSSAISGILSGVTGAAGSLWSWFTGLGSTVVAEIGDIGGDLASVGRAIISGIVSGITGAAGDILNAIKGALPHTGVLGTALSAVGLAEGGIVTKPTLAVVGEAGYPEAVIPLKGGVSAMGFNDAVQPLATGMFSGGNKAGGGGGTQVTVYQNLLTQPLDATDVANETTWQLSRLVS
jgi:phage-related protein